MRVLVTGHRGYIGSVLVPTLAERGYHVTGCDTGLFDRCGFEGSLREVEELTKDIRDLSGADLRGFDAVIHLAGLSNDPLGNYRPELTGEINHLASSNLARSAAAAGVKRFIFASSCSVYGSATEDMLDEDSSFNPVTPYGESKAAAERDIAALAGDGFSPVAIRAGTVYGPSPRIRFDLVLNNLVAWAVATREVRMKSDGDSWRPLVHVADVAQAYVAALEAPTQAVHREAFNVGRTGENYRIIELARLVEETVPDTRIVFTGEAGRDSRNYRVNCDKLKTRLPAFDPQWSAAQGARAIFESLRRCPVTPEEFEGARYGRIAQVQALIAEGRLDEELRWIRTPA